MQLVSRHSWPVIVVRTTFCILAFIIGSVLLRFSQQVFSVIFYSSPQWYSAGINLTKVHFVTLLVFLTLVIAPTKVRLTYNSKKLPSTNSFRVDHKGNLISSLSPNAVWISNHQIYTDWLFLWFLTYTSRFASSVYIVLKAALANVPILGPGMQAYKFLFLLRKWETDKVNLTNQLLEIDADARGSGPALGVACVASLSEQLPGVRRWPDAKNPKNPLWPYQLIVYPEGTVISPHTRERSGKYAEKLGVEPLKHVLLPRSRGLFLMLRSLRNTVEVVYDVTTGYSGLKATDYGEEVFTLKAYYLKGYGPQKVNFHIRGWNIDDIPLGDDKLIDIDAVDPAVLAAFEKWLLGVWLEKDKLMAHFYATGLFEDETNPDCETLEADFRLRSKIEVFGPFVTVLIAALLCLTMLRLLWRYFS